MDWQRTIRRLCRKHGVEVRDLEKAIGITQINWNRKCNLSAPRLKIMADRLGIPVEVLYLEALRDSKAIPNLVRIQLIKIIDEFRPVAGE